jgi:hypothetical protein
MQITNQLLVVHRTRTPGSQLMSKADYFRRFAVWNRQLSDLLVAEPASVLAEPATAEPESAHSVVTTAPAPTIAPLPSVTASNRSAAKKVAPASPASPPESSDANYLTTAEAAEICRLSVRTLERHRVSGGGPLYTKCGPGKRARVVYRRSDIDAWLTGNIVSSTANWSARSKQPK